MKWVFLLSLLLVAAVGGVLAVTVAYRWGTSMQDDVKMVPGQAALVQPTGTVPWSGGELVVARDAYEARKNPVASTPESVARGARLFAVYCTPCHGPGGKGDGTVTPRFIPPPDLTSAAVQAKTDGHISYYVGYGGALMPAYGEALSVQDRWDVVNFVRTLAQR